MKKILRSVFVAAIILIIAGIYANVDKKTPVYDEMVDTSEYENMGEIIKNLPISQTFICERDVLDGVSLKWGILWEECTADYEFWLIDAETEDILRHGEVLMSDIQNSRYSDLSFEQIQNCKGRKFKFVIASTNAEPGNTITIYNVPSQNNDEIELEVNGYEWENYTLAMRTISHMFDVETFISVAFCLLYLYVFVKGLYKFFS